MFRHAIRCSNGSVAGYTYDRLPNRIKRFIKRFARSHMYIQTNSRKNGYNNELV